MVKCVYSLIRDSLYEQKQYANIRTSKVIFRYVIHIIPHW